jgi:hypothetical protein
MSNATTMTPSSNCRAAWYPASVNTVIILRFSGSTSAVNRVMPCSRAACARCSSSNWPSPRPWCRSSTRKATSATLLVVRSYRPTAIISPATITISASRSR